MLCRHGKIGSIELADLLSTDLTIEIQHAEDKGAVSLAAARGFNMVAVIARREAKDAKNGNLYLKWHLTGVCPRCATSCSSSFWCV